MMAHLALGTRPTFDVGAAPCLLTSRPFCGHTRLRRSGGVQAMAFRNGRQSQNHRQRPWYSGRPGSRKARRIV